MEKSLLQKLRSIIKKEKVQELKRNIKWYGYVRDLPDYRDHLYAQKMPREVVPLEQLPSSVDLREKCPSIYDQGNLGSCTANAVGAAIQFIHSHIMPSRLFIYYNERSIEGTVEYDAGGQLRDTIKAVVQVGVCDESLWEYDITKFADKPSATCYRKAKEDIVAEYLRVTGLQEMKSCLAAGFPFIFGFTVFDSFESEEVTKSGVVNLPEITETPKGGHAVMCVGYDDLSERFIVRNSWGEDWGQKGYFTMPYAYVADSQFADDMWTIRAMRNN